MAARKSLIARAWIVLTSNMVAKLMALAMAAALWLYAFSFSYVPSTTVPIALQVTVPEGWSIDNPPFVTEVEVNYPRRFSPQVEQAILTGAIHVACVAPPPEDADEPVVIELRDSNLVAPRSLGIRVVRFVPDNRLSLRLIREITRNLPVIPRVSEPPPGYTISYKGPIPATVPVRGRKDIVSRARGIATIEIDISAPPPVTAVEWSIQPTVGLISNVEVDGVQYAVEVEQAEVQCLIILNQVQSEKLFENIPIQLMAPPDYPYQATLREGESAANVTVRGPVSVVDAVRPENIVLYVDVRDLKPRELPDIQRVEAQILRTPRASELFVTPSIMDVRVKISQPPPK